MIEDETNLNDVVNDENRNDSDEEEGKAVTDGCNDGEDWEESPQEIMYIMRYHFIN